MALKYDTATNDNSETPNVSVFSVHEDNDEILTTVAVFYIAPDSPGGLSLETAHNLAQVMCIDLNSWHT